MFVNGVVLDADTSRGGPEKPGKHPQCGGFTGAIRTQEPQDFAFLDVKVDMIHCTQIMIILGQGLDMDHLFLLELEEQASKVLYQSS
jgi:hypothetical protein